MAKSIHRPLGEEQQMERWEWLSFSAMPDPDIRWCGNEHGYAGETNWATIDTDSIYAGKSGIGKLLNSGQENGKNYIPSEVDVSIRPGWFYHAAVKSDSYRGNSKLYAASNITDGKKETY